MLEIGSLVDGKYKILSKIGQGGMSVVYMAINERANKTWAIKEVRKDGVQNFEVVKQGLIVETDMLKRLHHPNIPAIIDVVEDEERFLIVMDYIEGNSLQKALKDYGPQNQEDVIEWAKQLCDALGYLHSRKPPIIYRDMKPSNVMLKPDGTVSLIDFGTAREYKVGSSGDTSVLGTKGYAAPEQYGGHGQTDARTDIYCLGATLHQLLTGQDPCQPPYTRKPLREYNPSLSSGLEQIIMKCTRDDPDERYQSCAELMYALEHYDELDEEYRHKQNLKLGMFITTTVISLAAFIATGALHVLASSTKKNNYEEYLEDAMSSVTKEGSIQQCMEAIDLDPYRGEAYMQMLDLFMEDGNFTEEDEAIYLRQALSDGNRKKNEDVFRSNEEAYDAFAYQVGLDYFYSYEENGNKGQSAKWLEIAANSKTLQNSQVERARHLGRIAKYYSQIGKENKAGDASVTYLDYWRDLTQLAEGDLVQADNATTALMTYKELVYQIYTYTEKYKNAGVTKEEITTQLDNITMRLESISDEDSTRVSIMKNQLRENLSKARRSVEITYAGGK